MPGAAEERERLESALVDADARARLHADLARSTASFLLDDEGRVRGWNDGAARVLGHPAERVVGRAVSELYAPEDVAQRVPEELLARARSRGEARGEAWLVRPDGSRFWGFVGLRALGGGRGFAQLVRDDTDRKHTEQRLAAQLGVARALAESADEAEALPRLLAELGVSLGFTVGVAWARRGGRLRVCASWSGGPEKTEPLLDALRACALAPGEGIAGHVWQTGGPAWVDDLRVASPFTPADAALEAGLLAVFAFPVIAGSEVVHVLQLLGSERRHPEEELVQVAQSLGLQIGTFVERVRASRAAREAERRRADQLERRVEERTRELVNVNRELEAFSWSVSHDLRAPLRAVGGFSQALLEDHAASLDPQARDYLSRIRAAADRMSALIDDLLQLARLSRAELERRDVDVSALVEELACELADREPARRIAVEVQPAVRAHADPRLLRVALANLLENAFKFTRGAAAPRVAFTASEERGGRTYHVRDNGAGFDMAYASRLFKPFQRLHAASEFEGTGIGLATLQRIVHRHGGRVWAEGAPREGAAFHFTLGEAPERSRAEGP